MEHVIMKDFESKVLQSKNPVVVDFYADWCGPCRRLAPLFEELSEEIDGMTFLKVNVEESADVAAQYGVQSIPTVIVFKGGEPVDRVMGLMPKDELKKVFTQYI